MLLVVDMRASAGWLRRVGGQVAGHGSGLHVVATSRQVVGIEGEQAFPVPALSVLAADGQAPSVDPFHYESLRLFVGAGAEDPAEVHGHG
jgi:hypothetical protein